MEYILGRQKYVLRRWAIYDFAWCFISLYYYYTTTRLFEYYFFIKGAFGKLRCNILLAWWFLLFFFVQVVAVVSYVKLYLYIYALSGTNSTLKTPLCKYFIFSLYISSCCINLTNPHSLCIFFFNLLLWTVSFFLQYLFY